MKNKLNNPTAILYHHRTQGQGAEWVHSHYIIEGFRKLGARVFVVGPFGEVTDIQRQNSTHKKTPILARILRLLSKMLPQLMFELLELSYNYIAKIRLEKVIKCQKIDFIYERHAFFFTAGVRLAKQYNIPMAIEVNEVAGTERVRKQTLVKLSQRKERYVFANVNKIFVVSDTLKNNIMRYGVTADKIHVLPNAVDINAFSPRDTDNNLCQTFNVPVDRVVVGFVGGFAPWHNVDLLINVFATLAPTNHLHLVLVGEGKLKQQYQQLCKKLGLLNQVSFAGFVAHDQLPEMIDMMDICIMPGSNDFGSPLKIFEYMALAKPVIAPRYGPTAAVIEHEVNGLLFTPFSEQEFLTCLQRLITDEPLRKTMGRTARRMLIEHKHTWVDNCKTIMNTLVSEVHQPAQNHNAVVIDSESH